MLSSFMQQQGATLMYAQTRQAPMRKEEGSIIVTKGGFKGRHGKIIEVEDLGYFYVSVKTKFGNYVKTVLHRTEFEFI
ncbi:TPA: hypothetical protein I7E55_002086 [Vibrio cholerae]|nr:hypothetical protein [Vibrio cholerae]